MKGPNKPLKTACGGGLCPRHRGALRRASYSGRAAVVTLLDGMTNLRGGYTGSIIPISMARTERGRAPSCLGVLTSTRKALSSRLNASSSRFCRRSSSASFPGALSCSPRTADLGLARLPAPEGRAGVPRIEPLPLLAVAAPIASQTDTSPRAMSRAKFWTSPGSKR